MALYQKVPEQSIISFLDNFEDFLSFTERKNKCVLCVFPIFKKMILLPATDAARFLMQVQPLQGVCMSAYKYMYLKTGRALVIHSFIKGYSKKQSHNSFKFI